MSGGGWVWGTKRMKMRLEIHHGRKVGDPWKIGHPQAESADDQPAEVSRSP